VNTLLNVLLSELLTQLQDVNGHRMCPTCYKQQGYLQARQFRFYSEECVGEFNGPELTAIDDTKGRIYYAECCECGQRFDLDM